MSNCRFCNTFLNEEVIDLGMQPPCNANVSFEDAGKSEQYFPLKVYICSNCYLVQVVHDLTPSEIFNNYTYFSSYSSSWLEHAKIYSQKMKSELNLNRSSFVVEIASNDGYLLKNFNEEGIPCLGVEPAQNVAKVALNSGINTVNEYFSTKISTKIESNYRKADLIIANNVLAHVPDINDFVRGIKNLLSNEGVSTIEFPYLKNLFDLNQFDTIYHEHFFYYSVSSVSKILNFHKLSIVDIEELNTHGGSLRLFVKHLDENHPSVSKKVEDMLKVEKEMGVDSFRFYQNFNARIQQLKNNLLKVLIDIKEKGMSISGYGAPGKGNTLLNYCGIRSDLVSFTVDRNPAKQNTFLPGSRIPVFDPKKIKMKKPDYILILPWNLQDEIMSELNYVQEWGARFIIAIPNVKIL